MWVGPLELFDGALDGHDSRKVEHRERVVCRGAPRTEHARCDQCQRRSASDVSSYANNTNLSGRSRRIAIRGLRNRHEDRVTGRVLALREKALQANALDDVVLLRALTEVQSRR